MLFIYYSEPRRPIIFIKDEIYSIKSHFEEISASLQSPDCAHKNFHIDSIVLQLESLDFISKVVNLLHSDDSFFYYISPDSTSRFLAIGEIAHWDLQEHEIDAIQKMILSDGQSTHGLSGAHADIEFPLLFLQKMFNKEEDVLWSDFSSRLYIPEFIFLSGDEGTFVIQNILSSDIRSEKQPALSQKLEIVYADRQIEAAATPFHPAQIFDEKRKEAWHDSVEKIRSEIKKETISKAVLSRHITYNFDSVPDYIVLVNNLDKQVLTHRYIFRNGNSLIAGASPERLFSIQNGTLFSEAIAGSSPRGNNDEEDERLEYNLLHSSKELFEHECVTNFIVSTLKKHGADVQYASQPSVKKMLRLMHLWTKIEARGFSHFNLQSLINDLYPTPATCGEPKEKAFTLISELEPHARGLYCGLKGWITNKQDGEFFILLRLALLQDLLMHVFAGCGIVQESDAENEFEESHYKAQSIIKLFL